MKTGGCENSEEDCVSARRTLEAPELRRLLHWELIFFWHGQTMCLPSFVQGEQYPDRTPTGEAGRLRR